MKNHLQFKLMELKMKPIENYGVKILSIDFSPKQIKL